MIIGGPGSEKSNPLLNLISQQDDIDKIYLYAENLSEPKYGILIKRLKNVRINYLNDPNVFSECSSKINGVYENTDDYSSNRQRKILIVFDEMCRHYDK